MKFQVFFSFFLLSTLFGFSQNLSKVNNAFTLNWEPSVLIKETESSNRKILSLKGANYSFEDDFLPRFSQKVVLEAGENFTTAFKNTVYQEMSTEEASSIKNASKISSEISIQSDVLVHKKQKIGMISFVPVRKNAVTGKLEKLVSYDLTITPTIATRGSERSTHAYAANSVLRTGAWYKVAILSDGIYKLSYSLLKSMGIDVDGIDPRNIRIYGNGGELLPELSSISRKDDLEENAIYVEGENDGKLNESDYVLFYGKGAHAWKYNNAQCPKFQHVLHLYSDSSYYYITVDLGAGKRILPQASSTASVTHTVTSFDDYAFHENQTINFLKSGRLWFGEYFDNTSSYNIPFSFPNINVIAPATVKVNLASRYEDLSGSSSAIYSVSSQSGSSTINVPEIVSGGYSDYASIGSSCFTFTPNSPVINVNITKQTADAVAWLDYIEVNVRRELNMSGSQMMTFRDVQSVGAGNIAQYNIQSTAPIQVWDITNLSTVASQSITAIGTSYQFTLPSDVLKQFIAFDGSAYLIPVYTGTVANQNLHALSAKDFIIVAHPDFYAEAVQLASFHETKDNLSSIVVTPQQIYNEFSSGSQDISAIRDFVKMFYDKAGSNVNELPKYLLLFGDGSYDNKRKGSNTNFIPTYQSLNSLNVTSSYVSDDFYGLLDDNEGIWNSDAVDIGIGRFPVKTKQEAQAAFNKIITYTKTGFLPTTNTASCSSGTIASPFGDWRNTICFVGDDEDYNTHLTQANDLATKVDTAYNSYNVDKIYLDAYQQESTPGGQRYPGVVEAINKRIEKGCLVFNYTGHGGEVGLAQERILETSQINKWNNINNLPLFFTATCEFSKYDDPDRTSAGEYVFLSPTGGGIALFTTVRLVYSIPNFVINKDFYDRAFVKVNGKMPSLGDLYEYIKTQPGGNSPNSRNFTLLGDPALTLTYPKYDVSTDSINAMKITTTSTDTLKALSTVNICGSVKDHLGNVLSNFNGILYPTVYDKKQNINTLSNDGAESSVYTFSLQKNILYKGKVSVTNGHFKFTFVVPKDISYQFDKGRISYYAENGTEDANGYYEQVVIGGSNDAALADQVGPEAHLYLNDEKFVFGGLTNENPDLYAIVKDANGINTVGNGIGHDITATLDANTEHVIVLNDYYQADLNSYQSGKIRYPFDELSEGKHTLSLKVWDVYNNSSQTYTEFVVARSAELALNHVLNYPNPFTTKTQFYFEHNQCCVVLEAQIQIFTVSGKLVKTISQFVNTEGYRSEPMDWDGRDEFGDKIGRGVYVYRVKVKDSTGATAEKFEKLVILN